jgi:hypothetical protein
MKTMTNQEYFGFVSMAEQKFKRFHDLNPQVFNELVELALKMKRAGRKRYGINSLIEVVRWHRNLNTQGDEFKINNNFAPFYSRIIMLKAPELEGFFNLREQKVLR